MPHERKRHLEPILKQIAKLSPLVGILGHRQVGKTTLLEKVGHSYLTFDDEETLSRAIRNPKAFISENTKLATAIDECQLAENLFPALKERVRVDRRPGQFFLSGSVRFTSKKLIRESLTGRIISMELLPMSLSELTSIELPDWVVQLQKMKDFRKAVFKPLSLRERKSRQKAIAQYLGQGGLPGICFIRDERLRNEKIFAQLETILNRDLRQVQNTSLTFRELIQWIRALAAREGELYNFQEIRRETGISPITQKKLLFALESIFLIRQIPCEGDFSGFSLFFEDQAEVLALSQQSLSEEQQWSGLVYRNFREQFYYRLGSNAEFFQFRTRAGVIIPIVVKTNEVTWGILPVLDGSHRQIKAAADSFLKRYPSGKVLIIPPGGAIRAVNDRILEIPAEILFF